MADPTPQTRLYSDPRGGLLTQGSVRPLPERGRFNSCHPDNRIGPLTCRDAGQAPFSRTIRATYGVKVTVAQRQCRVGLVSPPLESEVDTCSGHDQVGLPEPSGRRPLGCLTGMAPPNQGVA